MSIWRAEFGDAFEGRRVLVTGATGFIGRRLCQALVELGATVVATGRRASMGLGVAVTYHAWRLEDGASGLGWLRGSAPHYIVHLASPPDVPPSLDAEREFAQVIKGSVEFLGEIARLPDIRGIVLAGSIKELGKAPTPYQDLSPSLPTGPYGVAKATLTALAHYLRSAQGTPICVLRLTTVYGPGQPEATLISQACRAALREEPLNITSGSQVRDFLFLNDAVRALLAGALHAGRAEACVFNVGSGHALSVVDLVRAIMRLSGSRAEVRVGSLPGRPWDVPDMRVDPSPFRALTGWAPQVTLEEGLRRTLAWHREALSAGSRLGRESQK